jgi:hypothetical protein
MAQVKFTSRGSVIIEVTMKYKDSSKEDNSLYFVDTGATCTTINREQLYDLGYDDNWIRTTGKKVPEKECPLLADKRRATDCYKIKLPSIKIEGIDGGNWEFMTSFDMEFNLLFGTDSMRFFNWAFDYMNGMCRFHGIPRLKGAQPDGEQYILSLDEEFDSID